MRSPTGWRCASMATMDRRNPARPRSGKQGWRPKVAGLNRQSKSSGPPRSPVDKP